MPLSRLIRAEYAAYQFVYSLLPCFRSQLAFVVTRVFDIIVPVLCFVAVVCLNHYELWVDGFLTTFANIDGAMMVPPRTYIFNTMDKPQRDDFVEDFSTIVQFLFCFFSFLESLATAIIIVLILCSEYR